jgi:hypothetical protein
MARETGHGTRGTDTDTDTDTGYGRSDQVSMRVKMLRRNETIQTSQTKAPGRRG